MRTTWSIIKADIGSVGGHIRPSRTNCSKGSMAGTLHLRRRRWNSRSGTTSPFFSLPPTRLTPARTTCRSSSPSPMSCTGRRISITYDVAALLRDYVGNRTGLLMPVRRNVPTSYSDGPRSVPNHADVVEKRQQQTEISPATSVKKALYAWLMDVYNRHRGSLPELDVGLFLFAIAIVFGRLKSFKDLALIALATLFLWAKNRYLPKEKVSKGSEDAIR